MGVDVKTSGDWQEVADRTPTGAVIAFAGTTPPAGWLLCDGASVSRSTYATLFDAIGVTWGPGDNPTEFNLPDLRGAFLRGSGAHATETMDSGASFEGPNVGVFVSDSTKRPNTAFTTSTNGAHNHNYIRDGFVSDAGRGGYGAFRHPENTASTSTNGNHSHSIAGGGDPETRPFAAGVNFIIKT